MRFDKKIVLENVVDNKIKFFSKYIEVVEFTGKEIVISKNAFKDFEHLKKILVRDPDATIIVKKGAFIGCKNLEEFPFENCSIIGDRAFKGANIKKINASSKLKYIGPEAFSCCIRLKEVDLFSSNIIDIKKFTFCQCFNLNKVVLPLYCTSYDKDAFVGIPHKINIQGVFTS